MKKLLMAGASLALLAACGQQQSDESVADTPPSEVMAETPAPDASPMRQVETTAPDFWGEWGIDLGAMDQAATPGDDFFRYVNGTWLDEFEIPADRTSYGAFNILREKSEQQVQFIIDDLSAEEPALDTPAGKIAAYYNAYLDVEAINSAGLTPAQPYLAEIDAMESLEDLATLFGTPGYQSPFGGGVGTDNRDPNSYIMRTGIGGLGMPSREYYLNEDERSAGQRDAYVSMLTFMLEKLEYENAADVAADIMALETQLAEAAWDRAASRNPEITYNKLTWDEFSAIAGDFPIDTLADAWGPGPVETILATQIPPTEEELEAAGIDDPSKIGGGFPAVFELVQTTDLDTWKAYMKAHFLVDHAAVLPTEIDRAVFDFYGRTLRGQQEQRPRDKRAVQATQGALGEAIGEIYVERHFPPENKAAMDELVVNLRKAMDLNLEDLAWMGDETRALAVDKLIKFTPKIGYPEEFEQYDELVVSNTAFENVKALQQYRRQDNISRLGTEVDRNEWGMTPQTVNAYYRASFNQIVFPAGILQPPFFNISADPAVNYGAIGAVIGHEIGHGFDDQGSKYDGDGVLRNWWTDEDRAAFDVLGTALVEQYNEFCPFGPEDICVNGRLALGENIGDLGGLSLAYRAYRMSLGGEEAPVIDGFTGDQRFFMAWAQVWRSEARERALRAQLVRGPHSPPLYRVNGIVRNFDEWYEAFGVTEDDEMYLPPEERVRIW